MNAPENPEIRAARELADAFDAMNARIAEARRAGAKR